MRPSTRRARRSTRSLCQLLGVAAAVTLALGCAGRLEGRQLRWHDTRAVERKPNMQEGGRKAHSPSHRASDSRPRAEQTEKGVFESERMDIDRYRVFVQTEQDERNQRYGPPKKKRKKKAKPAPLRPQAPAK